ncbi:hypothetical protein D3C59_34890 [Streptomyces sp. SHP22-7]|nr:hypothetical protein D3C59_34890 [Streptomyces sp. SHP22-7]
MRTGGRLSGGTDTSGTATGVAASIGAETFCDARASPPSPRADPGRPGRVRIPAAVTAAPREETSENLRNLW